MMASKPTDNNVIQTCHPTGGDKAQPECAASTAPAALPVPKDAEEMLLRNSDSDAGKSARDCWPHIGPGGGDEDVEAEEELLHVLSYASKPARGRRSLPEFGGGAGGGNEPRPKTPAPSQSPTGTVEGEDQDGSGSSEVVRARRSARGRGNVPLPKTEAEADAEAEEEMLRILCYARKLAQGGGNEPLPEMPTPFQSPRRSDGDGNDTTSILARRSTGGGGHQPMSSSALGQRGQEHCGRGRPTSPLCRRRGRRRRAQGHCQENPVLGKSRL